MTEHAGLRTHLVEDGALEVEGYCSCHHLTDSHPVTAAGKAAAARELVTHLKTCPDEGVVFDVSWETEMWVADRYPDETLTLDEWREQYG